MLLLCSKSSNGLFFHSEQKSSSSIKDCVWWHDLHSPSCFLSTHSYKSSNMQRSTVPPQGLCICKAHFIVQGTLSPDTLWRLLSLSLGLCSTVSYSDRFFLTILCKVVPLMPAHCFSLSLLFHQSAYHLLHFFCYIFAYLSTLIHPSPLSTQASGEESSLLYPKHLEQWLVLSRHSIFVEWMSELQSWLFKTSYQLLVPQSLQVHGARSMLWYNSHEYGELAANLYWASQIHC